MIVAISCLILIAWTIFLISLFRASKKPFPPTRMSWPVRIFMIVVAFIFLNVGICNLYIHFDRIDILIGVEAYILITGTTIIFILLRKRHRQSGDYITKMMNDDPADIMKSHSLFTDDKTYKNPFNKKAFAGIIIGILVLVISAVFVCRPGVVAGAAIFVISLYIGMSPKLKKRQ